MNITFPMHVWCRLLRQDEMTINMMIPYRRNPRRTAYEAIEGPYHFEHTPMAPPGTNIVVHENPKQRRTWAPHGVDGWYIGPAMKHYICFTTFINITRSESNMGTIHVFDHIYESPSLTQQQEAISTSSKLITLIDQTGTKVQDQTTLTLLDLTQKVMNVFTMTTS